jgi:hypothetical protein
MAKNGKGQAKKTKKEAVKTNASAPTLKGLVAAASGTGMKK